VSPPEAVILGLFAVAAFAIVNSLTADPVAVKTNNSFPPLSKILVTIFGLVDVAVFITGLVKVLFVKVCVPVRVTSPAVVENPVS
jgi:predicted outer membrane lipoprotein